MKRQMSIVTRIGGYTLLVLLAVAGCQSDPTVETTRPGIVYLTRPPQSDTISARSGGLAIRLLDEAQRSAAGTLVRFVPQNMKLVGSDGISRTEPVITSADSRGEAAVFVEFGDAAGVASIVAEAPALQISDTLTFTVLSGAPTRLVVEPRDTVVFVGAPVTLRERILDRLGNALEGQVSRSVVAGPVTLEGSNLNLSGVGIGVVAVTFESLSDTVRVTALPDGEIAALRGNEILILRTDGSSVRNLSIPTNDAYEASVDWSPDGSRLVVGGMAGFRIINAATNQVQPLTWPTTAGSNVIWPRFAPSGTTIYYSSQTQAGSWDVRQLDSNGANPVVLLPHDAAPGDDLMPSSDPDGSRIVFTADREEYSRFVLRVLDLGSGTLTSIDVEGTTPEWSPGGDLIAFQELGVVGFVAPNGANVRTFFPASHVGGWSKGVSWSPDGRWLVGLAAGRVEIMEVATGNTVGLPHLGSGFSAVAWRPAP